MASSLFILCIEPLLSRMFKRMKEISPSPFIHSPNTNISCYADDTTPIISHLDQLPVIDDELQEYGRHSGGRVNWDKCEMYLFGSWNQKQVQTKYKVVRDGLKVLGIYFGEKSPENWESLRLKFETRLQFYKSKSNATSLLAKSGILNMFVLPILWYVLKVLNPPDAFLRYIERMCEQLLWESRRHWVKKAMVYTPFQNDGLGVKSPRVQLLIFRFRALQKAQELNCEKFFLSNSIHQSSSIIFKNYPSRDQYYEET